MIKKTIVIVFGVRPHFIKLSALIPELKKKYEVILVHTGQHYDENMFKIFYSQLEQDLPHHNLSVNGQETHTQQIAQGMLQLEPILLNINPHWLIVIGDANPALIGALVASKLGIRIVHIEAGSYSTCLTEKSPEETNRRIVDSISDVYFCPTRIAQQNLIKKGIDKHNFFVGDLLVDVYLSNTNKKDKIDREVLQLINKFIPFNLVTLHREENLKHSKNLQNIVNALLELKENIIFPMHPRTKLKLSELGLLNSLENSTYIKVLKPVSYIDMLNLIKTAKIVLTDSSGLQREAYIAHTPSIILRTHNEYPEMINTACSILAGNDTEKIVNAVKYNMCTLDKSFDRSLFGKGDTAIKITNILSEIDLKGDT